MAEQNCLKVNKNFTYVDKFNVIQYRQFVNNWKYELIREALPRNDAEKLYKISSGKLLAREFGALSMTW